MFNFQYSRLKEEITSLKKDGTSDPSQNRISNPEKFWFRTLNCPEREPDLPTTSILLRRTLCLYDLEEERALRNDNRRRNDICYKMDLSSRFPLNKLSICSILST